MSNANEGVKGDCRVNCGIIMPISPIDGYRQSHWSEVLEILCDAVNCDEFDCRLVSNSDSAQIIQARIVQNLYSAPIAICDVSGKNPNVMFELGMRIAFDKPTVIVKDECTPFSFDTSPIEHLEYPSDLRYKEIAAFKEALKSKVAATYQTSTKPDYRSFLHTFGSFKVAKIETEEVSKAEFMMEQIDYLTRLVEKLHARMPNAAMRGDSPPLSGTGVRYFAEAMAPTLMQLPENQRLSAIANALEQDYMARGKPVPEREFMEATIKEYVNLSKPAPFSSC